MIRDAIDRILGLGQVQSLEFDGREYTDKKLLPVLLPEPEVLGLHTLTGIRDYLQENPDGLDLDEVLIHVATPVRVDVFSRLAGPFEQRKPYLRAVHEMPAFSFGTYMDIEPFIVEL